MISRLLNKVVPRFRALPGFRAPKAVDRPSALNPGTTVLCLVFVKEDYLPGVQINNPSAARTQFFFRSTQQLPILGYGPLKDFMS